MNSLMLLNTESKLINCSHAHIDYYGLLHLTRSGFTIDVPHTSGHATVSDILRVITDLEPKQIIPVHTMVPYSFVGLSKNVVLKEDGKAFNI